VQFASNNNKLVWKLHAILPRWTVIICDKTYNYQYQQYCWRRRLCDVSMNCLSAANNSWRIKLILVISEDKLPLFIHQAAWCACTTSEYTIILITSTPSKSKKSPLLLNLARISWCTDPRIQLRNFYINSLPLLFHLIKLAYKGARPQIIIMMMCQHA